MSNWVKCTLARGENGTVWVNLDQVVTLRPVNLGTTINFAGKEDQIVVKQTVEDILSGGLQDRES